MVRKGKGNTIGNTPTREKILLSVWVGDVAGQEIDMDYIRQSTPFCLLEQPGARGEICW